MSTAELNSNGKNDKKPAKEKDAILEAFQWEEILQRLYIRGDAIEEERVRLSERRVPVQARRRKTLVYVVSHTVEAVVHLWSLRVLTAAGCGIGSVHAVVRSNLLVEPSEVEEGEM
ncbi:hypothetical protein F511_04131 [Dorcoceras hygrometricum]|nr:hypothetical protein F511_04131 [Dorcoceras hygrometricum]